MEKQVLDKSFVPYLSKADINAAIEKMAATINADYDGKKPLFIAILNGSFMFASDLFKKIEIPAEISLTTHPDAHCCSPLRAKYSVITSTPNK